MKEVYSSIFQFRSKLILIKRPENKLKQVVSITTKAPDLVEGE